MLLSRKVAHHLLKSTTMTSTGFRQGSNSSGWAASSGVGMISTIQSTKIQGTPYPTCLPSACGNEIVTLDLDPRRHTSWFPTILSSTVDDSYSVNRP